MFKTTNPMDQINPFYISIVWFKFHEKGKKNLNQNKPITFYQFGFIFSKNKPACYYPNYRTKEQVFS